MRRGNPLVLLVEDDNRVAQAMGLFIVHAGWRLHRAADGSSARAAFQAEEPDVVVLDLGLPDIDGR